MSKRYRVAKPGRLGCAFLCAALAVAVLAAVLLYQPVKRSLDTAMYPFEYREVIERECVERELPVSLVCAVVKCESGFTPDAVSSIGARGLMQLTEDTFDWVRGRLGGDETFDDMFDPETNLRYGVYLLSYLRALYGGTDEVLCAYHAGMNQVARWLEDPAYSSDGETLDTVPFDDTAHYLSKVTGAIEKYREIYQID